MAVETLQDLFLHHLHDMHFAEQTILNSLQKMSETASSPQLKLALDTHVAETREHLNRLEACFSALGTDMTAEESPAIESLTEEAEALIRDVQDAQVRDAAMLAAAQTIEHYEMSRYGALIAWADELGHDAIAARLQETLAEEKAADVRLNQLSDSRLSRQAVA